MNQLIGVQELAASLRSYTILDVRWRLLGPSARTDYDEGHIPGARFVDLETELSAPPDERGRHPLPGRSAFQTAMRRHGVTAKAPVVCYDLSDGTSAARAWWLLRYFGHRDVRVLDGGYAAWVEAGRVVSRDQSEASVGDFVADPGHLPLLDAAAAAHVAMDGILLDARAGERYRGESEPVDPVAGHIPGAVSAPAQGNVGTDGVFRPAERLREQFERLGVTPDRPVGAYCGSGVVAAQEVLALTIAGFTDAALYADSWSGWITDPSRPLATGPEPD